MTRRHYRVHGLDLLTTLELAPALRGTGVVGNAVELVVLADPPRLTGVADEPILRSFDAGVVAYEAYACDGGWVLRMPRFLEFRIARALDRVEAYVAPTVAAEYLPIVVQGALSAFLITMGGRLCLHASAVEHRDGIVAFAGPSGQGKTTVSAMAVAAGAGHVTDDILALRAAGAVWEGHRGTGEARLRPAAVSLRDRFAGAPSRSTVDDRLAVTMPRSVHDTLALDAVVLPRADRSIDEVDARRLPEDEAFLALHRGLRLVGWRDPDVLARQFTAMASLAATVPVIALGVPWGMPFGEVTGRAVLRAVDDVRAVPVRA